MESTETLQQRLAGRQAEAAAVSRRATQGAVSREPAADGAQPRRDCGGLLVGFGAALVPGDLASRVRLIMVVLGGLMMVFGFKAVALQENYRAAPTPVTCAELAARGSPGNAHVLLTEYMLLPSYVYAQKMGVWRGAWVPGVSPAVVKTELARVLQVDPDKLGDLSDEERHRGFEQLSEKQFGVDVIVWFPEARGAAYVDRMLESDTLDCTLVSDYGIGRLSRRDRQLLAEAYPRSDLSRCRVLKYGAPTSLAFARAQQFGGMGLLFAGMIAAGWSAVQRVG